MENKEIIVTYLHKRYGKIEKRYVKFESYEGFQEFLNAWAKPDPPKKTCFLFKFFRYCIERIFDSNNNFKILLLPEDYEFLIKDEIKPR